MSRILPDFPDDAAYDAFKADRPRVLRATRAIARRHGLAAHDPEPFPNGSLVVVALGPQRVLKLYSPHYPEDAPGELAALRAVAGRLGVATPEVLATGELEGCPYLLMSRVPGLPANEGWDERRPRHRLWGRVPRAAQLDLARALGRAVARLHAIPPGELPEPLQRDPAAFLAERRAACVAQQRRGGLSEAWLAGIPAFLDSVALGGRAPVLLHTEVMRDHVLLVEDPAGWRLGGLVDFEPAMLGDPDYELASVGVFFACGDGPLLREYLLAYGYAPAELDAALQRRILAWALLHRFSRVRWYMDLLGEPAEPSWELLAQRWFPFEEVSRPGGS